MVIGVGEEAGYRNRRDFLVHNIVETELERPGLGEVKQWAAVRTHSDHG
jgi:hypothetical protein